MGKAPGKLDVFARMASTVLPVMAFKGNTFRSGVFQSGEAKVKDDDVGVVQEGGAT
jgi:hypothetical protein